MTLKTREWNARGLAVDPIRDYNFVFMPVAAGLEEFDPLAPQREAALFYGLFLRGHSAETLRRDIDVPVKLLNKLMFRHRNEQAVRRRRSARGPPELDRHDVRVPDAAPVPTVIPELDAS